jgi:hypothetical protein
VREIVSFLKPNITIGMVDHFQSYPKTGLPPQVRTGREDRAHRHSVGDGTGDLLVFNISRAGALGTPI